MKKWNNLFEATTLHVYKLQWRHFEEKRIILWFWTFYYSAPIISVYSKTPKVPNDLLAEFKENQGKRNIEGMLQSRLWEKGQQKDYTSPISTALEILDFVTVT